MKIKSHPFPAWGSHSIVVIVLHLLGSALAKALYTALNSNVIHSEV